MSFHIKKLGHKESKYHLKALRLCVGSEPRQFGFGVHERKYNTDTVVSLSRMTSTRGFQGFLHPVYGENLSSIWSLAYLVLQ